MAQEHGDRKYDPAGKDRLDSPHREKEYDIPELFEFIGLDEGQIVLDIGAGTGFFSTRFAEVVGEEGKIFAVDISQEMLDILSEKIAAQGISNIESVLSTEDRIELPAGLADLAFMSSVLHELEGDGTLLEIHRILKPGGKFGLVDWAKKKTLHGPPLWQRLSEEEGIARCEEIGFKHLRTFHPSSQHYGLYFERI